MYSYGSPHMAMQKEDDQHEHTFSSYVRIRDVVLKTYLERWTIGRSGERGSGISVLPARYDDDDDERCLQINILYALKSSLELPLWMPVVQLFDFYQQDTERNSYRRWVPNLLRRQSSEGFGFNPDCRRVTIQEYLTLLPGYG